MLASSTRSSQHNLSGFSAAARAFLTGGLLAPLLIGCQTAGPRAASQPAVPADTNAELVEYISDMPYVTAETACRAAYILAKREVFSGGYGDLIDAMQGEGLASKTWNFDADQFVNRAAVAALIARACDIRIGLNWRLTGLGRYAHRELIYLGIAHSSGEYGYISGGEFLGTLARAEEYVGNRGQGSTGTIELGDEP